MNDLVIESFKEVFPEKSLPKFNIKFSDHFKDFNANVRYSFFMNSVEFHLSRSWNGVSPEILKGLFQSLLVRVYRIKKSTINMELYDSFIKNLHISVPKTLSDPLLDESFSRVNEHYFSGFVELPNLKWGGLNRATLGTYDYKTDTVTITSVLKAAPIHLLDYVMYHELLHKKLKFHSKNGRSFHHTPNFRDMEKGFDGFSRIDSDMKAYLRASYPKRRKGFLDFFFTR